MANNYIKEYQLTSMYMIGQGRGISKHFQFQLKHINPLKDY